MIEPACPSCGVPYGDHLGLHGTCAALLEARRERDEARAEVALHRAALSTPEGYRGVVADAVADELEAEQGRRAAAVMVANRMRKERAQLLAWLRRPVDAEEVIAWLADRHIHVEGLKKRRNGGDGDVCWTDWKDWIVAYDVRISAARMAIADAIERGEPLSTTATTATTGGSKP